MGKTYIILGGLTMENTCDFTLRKFFKYTLLLGLVASLSHFVYELSGKNLIVGLLNPVNESIWEHLKFMFFPFLIWWLLIYIIKNKKCKSTLNSWIVSGGISLFAAPLLVVLLYYAYTEALGIESVVIDVLLVFISYFIALSIGSHFLKYSRPKMWASIIWLIVIAVIFIALIVFTIYPPDLPIFHIP